MLEKTNRMNYLHDFYQSLLTDKQRSYMSLYYFDDYSLGEIAEEYDISRQAVYDNIKRTEAMLEEYETKLKLLEKYIQKQQLLKELNDLLPQDITQKKEVQVILENLENLN